MKKQTLWVFSIVMLTLLFAGCNSNKVKVWMANPASVYCEDNGWTLEIEKSEEWDTWICRFDDGSYCEEWSFYRWECVKWDLIYNTVSGEEERYVFDSEIFTAEDLAAAEDYIIYAGFGQMNVRVEDVRLKYLWDEKSLSELDYCKSIDPTIDECIVYVSEFYIPKQDVQMAWAFEPDTTLSWYEWYLWREKGWEWKYLTAGY